MSRPTVQIDGPNLAPTLRRHLDRQLPAWQTMPGVAGITLNGGLARGYADELSEIDVTFFLDSAAYAAWQTQRSPVALGIVVIDGQLYDIKAVDLAHERQRAWESDALWDASYAEILHDPTGDIQALLAEKLGERPTAAAAAGHMMQCWWYYRLAGDIWIRRNDGVQGHAMLNQAAVALVKALFCANAEYVPHEKWLFHMSRSLAWLPDGWPARLTAMLGTGDMSIDSLIARQAAIDALWRETDAYLVAHHFDGAPLHAMQVSTYRMLDFLARRGSVTLAEWRSQGFGGMPNYEPFHSVVRVEGETIILDRERLLALRPDAMYAWHFAVADAVRSAP